MSDGPVVTSVPVPAPDTVVRVQVVPDALRAAYARRAHVAEGVRMIRARKAKLNRQWWRYRWIALGIGVVGDVIFHEWWERRK